VVFVDTPGVHKPRTLLGQRLNAAAEQASDGVDVVCVVVDARAGVGRGDERLLAQMPPDAVVVVNKVDGLRPDRVLAQLQRVAAPATEGEDLHEYFPVSARTGAGLDELVEHLVARLPEGPAFFPREQWSDTP